MKLPVLGCKGSGFLGTIITGAAYMLKLLEVQPASSNKCISSSMNFWSLRGMGYGFHAIGVCGWYIHYGQVGPSYICGRHGYNAVEFIFQ